MPLGGDSKKAGHLLCRPRQGRPLRRQRLARKQAAPPAVCAATFVAGGLRMPSVPSALLYAFRMKLHTFTLQVDAGSIHLMLRHGLHRMFDRSVVSIEGRPALQEVQLCDCWRVLLAPVLQPLVLHVHSLKAVGWRLWAADTLSKLIRHPHCRRDLYRLDQLSFVRLWRTAMQWDRPVEKRELLQLVSAACRKSHSINLRLCLVVRVPFGLQGLHGRLAQSIKTMVMSECTVHPSVRSLWLESLRVVQTQGRCVGVVLGSFRKWCRQLDCSPEGEDLPGHSVCA